MMRIIVDEKEFLSCTEIFKKTMNIQYVYTIQVILTTNEKFEKLLLKNVHSHWKFKKSKSFDENFEDNFDNNFFVRRFFYESKSKRVYEFDFDILDVDDFIRDDRIDSIVSQFNFDENENLNDLMNVVELKKIKIKKKSLEFKNKKNVMTKTQKKTAKFIKRNLS